MKSVLLIFFFYGLCFWYLRNICVTQGLKHILCLIDVLWLHVLHLELWSSLELIFMYSMSMDWSSFFLHTAYPVVLAPFLWIAFASFLKISYLYICESNFGIYAIPVIHVSLSRPITHFLDYFCFITTLEIRHCQSFNFYFFRVLPILNSLHLRVSLSISASKKPVR